MNAHGRCTQRASAWKGPANILSVPDFRSTSYRGDINMTRTASSNSEALTFFGTLFGGQGGCHWFFAPSAPLFKTKQAFVGLAFLYARLAQGNIA